MTALQRALLDVVSKKGPVTAAQVRRALQTTHPLSDSSIRTVLRRLEARGLLSHQRVGRSFRYRAETSSTRVATQTIRQLIADVWAGSAQKCLLSLAEEGVITAGDLERCAKRVRVVRQG